MTGSFNDNEGLDNNPGAEGGTFGDINETVTGVDRVIDVNSRSSVITARGTADGLVLRIDGRVDEGDLTEAVREFLESRRSFLQGNDVAFEWVGRKPAEGVVHELTTLLSDEYQVTVRSSKLKSAQTKPSSSLAANTSTNIFDTPKPAAITRSLSPLNERASERNIERNVSLFDGMGNIDTRTNVGANSMLWDEPDTRIVHGTLRSGQRVESEHSVVIIGDVNSGAEVIAGGDIIILGTLRGIAHAGAFDESGGGRIIFSLNLQPTQLRIGLVISRGAGSDNVESTPRGGIPEVARVESNLIVVEPYQSRTVWARKRE